MKSWHKTKFLLMGSSRGMDEHTARMEVKAHLQQAALVRGCFTCRSQETGPTGDWVSVWSGFTLLLGTPMEAASGLGSGVQGDADFLTETHMCCSIPLCCNHS